MVLVIALPTLLSGYLMTMSAEAALMEEKKGKLFGAARMLERHLQGTFDDILIKHGALSADHHTKVMILNKELQPFTDVVAAAYPGMGVGYYVRDLDVQATYGPSAEYAWQVGRTIGPDHPGRQVMATGQARVQVGQLMRGPIMNAMLPVVRQGEVIGYIYANELTAAIEAQTWAMKRQMLVILIIGLMIGIGGSLYLVNNLTADIHKITTGLTNLEHDLNSQIPPMEGEIGQIAVAINKMSAELNRIKQVEEQVQRMERLTLVGEIAAGLAHEIRNPLMAIRGFTQLLMEGCIQPAEKEYAAIVVKETGRLNRLVEQLLKVARPTVAIIEPIAVSEVIDNVIPLVNTKATRENIEIVCDIPGDLPRVLADAEQLLQVLLNLLLNSIQAIQDGAGRIDITATYVPQEHMVHISVADTGMGITEEHMKKIFDPFFTTKPHGTGLGLPVAVRLVKGWGGKILVSSSEKGSIFTVCLPAAEGVQAHG